MGIKYIRFGEQAPETLFGGNLVISTVDGNVQVDAGAYRMLPAAFVIEKGEPITHEAPGPSVAYVIEGEYQLEDKSTPGKPILFTKGDIVLSDAGTIMKVSSPSMARVFGATYMPAPLVHKDVLS